MAQTTRETRMTELREELESAVPLRGAAREFVFTAKRILMNEGFEALTLQRVAKEAGANKGSIWYYFGGKDGLIDAVIHDIVLENCAWVESDLPRNASVEERVDSLIRQTRYLLLNPESYGGGWDVFAFSIHHEQFRRQWNRMYELWFRSMCERLDIPEDVRSHYYSQLFAAMVDGLSVQQLMGLTGDDPGELDQLLDSMRQMVMSAVEQLRLSAAVSSAGGEMHTSR